MEIQRPLSKKHKEKIMLPESVLKLIDKLGGDSNQSDHVYETDECMSELLGLKPDEKKVLTVFPRFSYEIRGESLRKAIIDKGLLESVILLPMKLLDDTGIPLLMLVFSCDNQSVKMTDAAQIYHSDDKTKNILTEEDINSIVSLSSEESEFSSKIPCETIMKEKYDLSPRYYLKVLKRYENAVEFGSLIKPPVICGLQLRPEEKEKLHSDMPTDYQYIEARHMINGEIDMNLPYLSECRESYLNHQVKNHNIIISKIGRPLKVAVAEIPDNKTVIAVGRLYVFEINEEKSDPYYIKKYLSSEVGQEIMMSCNNGIAINSLELDKLLKMPIKLEEE
ncbi:MAG: N-6 DNA methylase [Clostridium sp.]|nr:N-6 DNA methylase [Clostridium sp.]